MPSHSTLGGLMLLLNNIRSLAVIECSNLLVFNGTARLEACRIKYGATLPAYISSNPTTLLKFLRYATCQSSPYWRIPMISPLPELGPRRGPFRKGPSSSC
uniref:Secreted protein n=1 Tax=Kalanchoe fedtschenkoi TaxID=63787 RepID=A0A7N0T709_KALFE